MSIKWRGDIGQALRNKDEYHVVAVRSTVLPGTIEEEVLPILEAESSKQAGRDFGLCMNPEFLREGTAIEDYYNPTFTLIGGMDQRSGAALAAVYRDIDAPIVQTEVRVAEMVKYTSNAYHALKVGFANEIGILCKEMAIDSHRVMDIFAQDTRLNISAKYLRPGFAFGGSCLPKDVRAIGHRSRAMDLDLPIMQSILPSNERQIERAFDMVQRSGSKKVSFLGLSFKDGTDDLRESPLVHLCEKLLGKGYDLRIYDRNVALAAIMGANKQYIDQVIPHISTLLLPDLQDVVDHGDVLIIGTGAREFRAVLRNLRADQQVIDLVRPGAGCRTFAWRVSGNLLVRPYLVSSAQCQVSGELHADYW